MTADDELLAAAVDLLPEAWHLDIEADAAGQRCTVDYVAGPDGPNTEAIARVLAHFGDRDEDDDWWAMSEGQRLDECFPDHHGIGSFELLDELGITAEYVEMSDREGMIQQ